MVRRCVAEVHFVNKSAFARYSWYKDIPEEGRKDIEDPKNLGLVISRRHPNRYICLLSDSVTDDEIKLLMDNLMSLLSIPDKYRDVPVLVLIVTRIAIEQADYIFKRLEKGLPNIDFMYAI